MARVNVRQTNPSEISVKRDREKEEAIKQVLDEIVSGQYKKDSGSSKDSCEEGPDPLAVTIRSRFQEAEMSRREVEQRWLKDLRQYRGQYDPDVLSRIHPNRSKAYIRITRNKVKTVDSRLIDLMLPANGDFNWSIRPTVIPELNQEALQSIIEEIKQSGVTTVTRDMLENAVYKLATDRSSKMEKKIQDQLSQMNYREVLRNVIHSGNLYGTGILKGPMITMSKSRTYVQTQKDDGPISWKLETKDELLPYIEQVPVWDFFPDMSSSSIRDARYCIQRHKMTKRQLLDLAKRADFMGEKVSEYLEKSQEGDWEDKYFDTQLKEMGDRNAMKFNDKKSGRKYEILEYWGYLDAKDLTAAGASIPDELEGCLEIASTVWVLGDSVIKAAVSHLDDLQWPFFLYYYDKDETSIFGEGIPTILRDIQELVNSAFRAMLDNAAISAGPQFEVNLDLLSEDEDPTQIYPFKVWLRTGEGADAQQEAVRVKQIPSHTTEFLQMCQAFESYADEVTTIPRYMWGENTPGISRTSSGMSMLMGSANITIKDQVKNADDGLTTPFISSMYHWNMKFTDDPSIKGDYDVRAEGMASLIAKEVYSQSLMNFLNIVSNPQFANKVNDVALLRGVADALDLGDRGFVKSDQEIAATEQQQAQQQQEQQDFMMRMTEAARKFGVSPTDMVESMRMAYSDQKRATEQMQQQRGMNGN